MTLAKIFQPCCDAWTKANNPGTDNEGWQSLIYEDRMAEIKFPLIGPGGNSLPPIKFCPWCGAEKTEMK